RKRTGSPAAFPATARLPMRGRTPRPPKQSPMWQRRRERRCCARFASSASASPTISATWATSATTEASLSVSRNFRGSRRTFAARASGVARDLRCDFLLPPYAVLEVRRAGRETGDVADRVAVRFDELFESLRLARALLDMLPDGEVCVPYPIAPAERFALGAV